MSSLNISDHQHEDRLLAVTLRPDFAEACLGCAVIGVLTFMCIYGLTVHLETPKEVRQGQRLYVAVSFAILVLHGFAELPSAYYIFVLLYKTSNWKEAYSLMDELNSSWWLITSNWANMIMVWVGDGLLVYRCHIVWTGRPLVTVLPALVYLTAIGVSIFVMIPAISRGHASSGIYPAWFFLSAGLNCLVTFLISFRLIYMRKHQAAVMVPIDSKVYIGVISILVESALPLAVAGVVAAGSNWGVRTQSFSTMHNVFVILWYNLCALAPSLIIFRLAVGRSWDRRDREVSDLSALAFQPNTSLSSDLGEMQEGKTPPFDLGKNGLSSTTFRAQIHGTNSDLTERTLNLPPPMRTRRSSV